MVWFQCLTYFIFLYNIFLICFFYLKAYQPSCVIQWQSHPMLTRRLGDKEVHTFSKGISPKENAMARLGSEITYKDVAVQYFSHYASGSSFR